MDGLSLASGIFAVLSLTIELTKIVHEYTTEVSHASASILDLERELNSLTTVLKQLADFLEEHEDVGASFHDASVLCAAKDACEAKIEYLCQRLKKQTSAQGAMKIVRRLKWPFETRETREIVESLRRCIQTFQLSLSIDNCKLLSRTSDEVTKALDAQLITMQSMHKIVPDLKVEMDLQSERVLGVLKFVSDLSTESMMRIDRLLKSGMADYRATIERDDRANMLTWLLKTDTSTNFSAARKKHEAHTGQWLLDSQQYRSWRSNASSFLWLHGIPGCGKTILSSTIIADLLSRFPTHRGALVAYHFFDFNDTLKQKVKEAVCSILAQCLHRLPSIPSSIRSLYESYMHGQQQPSLPSVLGTLKSLVHENTRVYLVIDALDECESIQDLMETISEIHSWQIPSLHIMVTSRNVPDIEESLQQLKVTQVSIQNAVVDADIRLHVKSRISKHKLKKWSNRPTIMEEIETTLVNGAAGMFRWVALQLDALEKCLSVPALQKTLRTLPKTLYETYDRVIFSIEEEYRDLAVLALQWLAYSTRPLKVIEVAEVLSMADGNEDFNPLYRISSPNDVLIICSSLVSLNKPDADDDTSSEELETPTEYSELRLAHFSVKEYLLSNQRSATAWFSGFSDLSANLVIAQNCLAYLQYFEEPNPFPFRQRYLGAHGDYPLLDYILGGSWLDHLQKIPEGRCQNNMRERIYKFFQRENTAFQNWSNYRTVRPEEPERNALPLTIAAGLGWTIVVSILIIVGEDINERSGAERRTALDAAVRGGHLKSVELLLAHGASLHPEDERSSSPLYEAVWADRPQIARLLLKAGADVNDRNGFFGTPLQVAVYWNRITMIGLLLAHGADEVMPGPNGSAVEIAEEKGLMGLAAVLWKSYWSRLARKPSKIEAAVVATAESTRDVVEGLGMERYMDSLIEETMESFDTSASDIVFEDSTHHTTSTNEVPAKAVRKAAAAVVADLKDRYTKELRSQQIVMVPLENDDSSSILDDVIFDPDFFRRERIGVRQAKAMNDEARRIADNLEERYSEPTASNADFFYPKDWIKQQGPAVLQPSARTDTDIHADVPLLESHSYNIPYAFTALRSSSGPSWTVPVLNLIEPTPPSSPKLQPISAEA